MGAYAQRQQAAPTVAPAPTASAKTALPTEEPLEPAPVAHEFGRLALRPPMPPPAPPAPPPPVGGLPVGPPGDSLEREAEAAAERVLRMSDAELRHPCSCGGVCPRCREARRRAGLSLQTHPIAPGVVRPATAPPMVHDVLRASGQPLGAATRTFFEPRFGHDFGNVRIHAGPAAEESARAVSAQAYTVGRDIVFGAGRFAPETVEGRRLLAHELTHVVQQSEGRGMGAVRLQRTPTPPEPLTRLNSRVEFYGKFFDYLIRDDIQWFVNVTGWFVDLVIYFESEKERQRVSGKQIGEAAVNVWETTTDITIEDNKRQQFVSYIGDSMDELGTKGRAYIIQFDLDDFTAIFEQESWKTYREQLKQSLGGKDVWLNGQLIASGNFATGKKGKKAGGTKGSAAPGGEAEPEPERWVRQRQDEINQLIAEARTTTPKPPDVPDRVVLWHNARDKSWYLNVWTSLDPQGKKKRSYPVKLKAGETSEELFQRVREATAHGLQRAEDREQRERARQFAPAWALELEKALKQRLDALHVSDPRATDFPDGLILVPSADIHLQVWVERKAGAGRERNYGTVPLRPDATVDQLVPYVRQLAALLRQYEQQALGDASLADASLYDPEKVALPAIPAQLQPVDLRRDNITVTGAKNEFHMQMDYEARYGGGPLKDLYIASKLYQESIRFHWEVHAIPTGIPLPEGEETAPASWERRWQWLYDAFNPPPDAEGHPQKRAVTVSDAPITKTDGSDSSARVTMPPDAGQYLVRCVTGHGPIGENKVKRLSSEAFYPVRVRPIKEVATEAASLRTGAITEMEADLAATAELLVAGDNLTAPQRDTLLAKQQIKTADLERLRKKETQTLRENTGEELAYARDMQGKAERLKALLPGILKRAKDENVTPSDLLKDTPELVTLYWYLIAEHKTADFYAAELGEQIKQLEGVHKRAGEFAKELKTSSRYQYSPEAAFVSKVTGHVYPLVFMLGEAPDRTKAALVAARHGAAASLRRSGGVAYSLVDVTSHQTQKVYYGYSSKSGPEGHRAAIDDAFHQFGEDATYGEGLIAVRIPPGPVGNKDENHPGTDIKTYRSKEGILQKVLWALGIIGAIAGVAALVATGVGAPVAAGILGAAAATAGAIASLHNISERQRRHTLEFDAELVMDLIGIVAVVPATVGARAAVRTAAGLRVAVVTERFLQIYAVGELGATAILVPTKLYQDIELIQKDTELTKEQQRLMIAQAQLGAVQSSVMLLSSAAAAHAGSRRQGGPEFIDENNTALKQQIELLELEGFGEYQSMEQRGWVDAHGKWTEKAPGIVRTKPAVPEVPTSKATPGPATPVETAPTTTPKNGAAAAEEDVPRSKVEQRGKDVLDIFGEGQRKGGGEKESYQPKKRKEQDEAARDEAEALKRLGVTEDKPVGARLAEAAEGREFDVLAGQQYPANQVPIRVPGRTHPRFLDSYDPIKGEIISRKSLAGSGGQVAFTDEFTMIKHFQEFQLKYRKGATIADTPGARAKGLANERLQGKYVLEVPVQKYEIPTRILDEARVRGITIRDASGTVYK